MREPEKIRTIVEKVLENTSLPVTVKTRTGISPSLVNISEVAQAVEAGGAGAIFIHGRPATKRHSGPVDFEAIKRVKSEVSIPVIGNGGITDAQKASEMLELTGVDGVMIGKGAIGNPWIFKEILHSWKGLPYDPPSAIERKEVIAEHLIGLYEVMEAKNKLRKHHSPRVERLACEAFRGHMGRYLHGQTGVRSLQGNLMQVASIESVIDAVSQILKIK